MNDREFIEFLNLYVDREISPEDALRLEAEVAAHPERRRIYDQYCRMQKACAMLSEQLVESAAEREGTVAAFPARHPWSFGPLMAGLAAAACLVAVVELRNRGTVAINDAPGVAVDSVRPEPAVDTLDLARPSDSMKPVFLTRLSAAQAARPLPGSMFADSDAQAQTAQLNWIGDIHLAPVYSSSNPDYLLTVRPDLKAAALNGTPISRDPQEPTEMAAFRFQR